MYQFSRHYTSENSRSPYVALDEAIALLGIGPRWKSCMDGSKVPEMISQGKFKAVYEYNALDVAATEALFKAMYGNVTSPE